MRSYRVIEDLPYNVFCGVLACELNSFLRPQWEECSPPLKLIVWCGFTASFILGPFFFKDIDPAGPVTCTVNGVRYESLLNNHVIAALKHHARVGNTILMQDAITGQGPIPPE
ncbi:hypothetical protein AVEN_6104-1 [Araneus ventricosus]|uniref:Uncharacterized protein n=1 Tax=Araneus ventricosus TaxID=182803 RepID=A0A4Y2JAR5_ARAVE|nr:hypothetical protein AVEN_6104-1 [Araneus ventricosus]